MIDPLRPPETDNEPPQYTQVSRELSGTVMALCFLGIALLVVAALLLRIRAVSQ